MKFLKKTTLTGGSLVDDDNNESISLEDAGKSASEFVTRSNTFDVSKIKRKTSTGQEDVDLLKKEIKFSFRPIDQVQQTADPEKLKREYAINLEPVKRDD